MLPRAHVSEAPAGCALEAVAAFQLAYQGYPWNPAKGYEKLVVEWVAEVGIFSTAAKPLVDDKNKGVQLVKRL